MRQTYITPCYIQNGTCVGLLGLWYGLAILLDLPASDLGSRRAHKLQITHNIHVQKITEQPSKKQTRRKLYIKIPTCDIALIYVFSKCYAGKELEKAIPLQGPSCPNHQWRPGSEGPAFSYEFALGGSPCPSEPLNS